MPSIRFVKQPSIPACFSAGRELIISSRSFAKYYNATHTQTHMTVKMAIFEVCPG